MYTDVDTKCKRERTIYGNQLKHSMHPFRVWSMKRHLFQNSIFLSIYKSTMIFIYRPWYLHNDNNIYRLTITYISVMNFLLNRQWYIYTMPKIYILTLVCGGISRVDVDLCMPLVPKRLITSYYISTTLFTYWP